MSKVRDISNLSNIIKTDASGNVSFVSGSTTLATINTSGQLSGSSPVLSSSYALNADLLDGLDSTQFTLTSSFAAQTASFTAFTASVNTFTASQLVLNGTYATTGSNTFVSPQTINSNLIVTGSITAQTLVVQTITSSVLYSSGSNVFGNNIANTQVLTGSVTVTGSLAVVTNGTEFQVTNTGVRLGNVSTDAHPITGSVGISGSLNANNTLYVSSSNVGIGIVPQELLHITGSSPAIRIGGARTYLLQIVDTDGRFRIHDNTAGERFTIASGSGNVGIGTISPYSKLDVAGSISINGRPVIDNSSAELYIGGITGVSGRGTDIIAFYTANTERMRLSANGYLSIGKTTSQSKALELYQATDAALRIQNSTTGTSNNDGLLLEMGGSNAILYNYESGYLAFGTANTERMRIASDGKVTITAPAHNQLTVKDSDASIEIGADDSTMIGIGMVTAGDGITWFTGRHRPGSSGIYDEMNVARLSGTWVNLFRIYSNGNWDFAGSDVSDVRLKENIKTIDYNAVEKLIQLVPKSYNMIEHPTISKSGFIAQEVKEILPSFVTGNESENEYLGVDYNGILALAVKAIQELKTEINELKAQING